MEMSQESLIKNCHYEIWYFENDLWQLATHGIFPKVILRDVKNMLKQKWDLNHLMIYYVYEDDSYDIMSLELLEEVCQS